MANRVNISINPNPADLYDTGKLQNVIAKDRLHKEYYLKLAIVELAADSRQPPRRYSWLCTVAANAEDAVRSDILQGFVF